ncbi:glycosyltransferase [Devosia limi]|nr:glycosyltransferase [Devosia limi]
MNDYPALAFVSPLIVTADGKVMGGADRRGSRHNYVRRDSHPSQLVWMRRNRPGEGSARGEIAVPPNWGLRQPAAVFVLLGEGGETIQGAESDVTVIVEQSIPEPDHSAGHRNIFEFVRTLVRDGQTVKFWAMDGQAKPEYAGALQRMGVEVLSGALRPDLTQWLRQHRGSIGRVLVCRPDVADFYLERIRAACHAPLIYYGHDLHFVRMRMQAGVAEDRRLASAADAMERLERSIWQRADIALYPTAEEVEIVHSLCPDAVARQVQIFCFDDFPPREAMPAGTEVLFVAGFGHAPNVDAAVWFAAEVFPLIVAECPDARLVIAGSAPPPEVVALASATIAVRSWLSEAELTEAYAAARVAVVPLRFGAGLKLKAVEALRNGVPLVTSPVGAQGLPDLDDVAVVAETHAQLAAAVTDTLSLNDADWLARANRQVDYAAARFGRAAMLLSLQAAFEAAEARRG